MTCTYAHSGNWIIRKHETNDAADLSFRVLLSTNTKQITLFAGLLSFAAPKIMYSPFCPYVNNQGVFIWLDELFECNLDVWLWESRMVSSFSEFNLVWFFLQGITKEQTFEIKVGMLN